jgi:histidine triad (HIT) family protein
MSDCIFCKMSNGEIPIHKIYENENFFSILDINQTTKGHALVISKKHFTTILEMPNSLGTELLNCIKITSLKLIEKYNADGFNIVNNNFESAGQLVKHVHLHILPRTKNDKVDMNV